MSTTPATQGAAPAATADATSTTSPAATSSGTPATTATAASPPAATPSTTTTPPETPAAPVRIVPATYTLTIPGGQTGPVLDTADVEAVAALGKTHQWTQEEAQAALQETHEQFLAQRQRLETLLKQDKEVGGEHLAAAQQAAVRVLDRFLPATEPEGAELRAFMNKTGYGNWTPVVKLLARVGQAMGEDSVVVRSATGVVRDPADILYDYKKA